ncbi:transmembrane protein, putative [Medicago truncatula]|uniref:Transmembrane protein, putative n=1 Tax=Medicago truncatula TaxID=3880 RepID=G7LDG3_MEDTR|nr:transmembrane protein, putative [Medicago truncatula]
MAVLPPTPTTFLLPSIVIELLPTAVSELVEENKILLFYLVLFVVLFFKRREIAARVAWMQSAILSAIMAIGPFLKVIG